MTSRSDSETRWADVLLDWLEDTSQDYPEGLPEWFEIRVSWAEGTRVVTHCQVFPMEAVLWVRFPWLEEMARRMDHELLDSVGYVSKGREWSIEPVKSWPIGGGVDVPMQLLLP